MKKSFVILLTVIILAAAMVSCDVNADVETTQDQSSTDSIIEETTTNDETTAPEAGDNETTTPEAGDNETTAPEAGDNETTAPEVGDNETTEPEVDPVDAFIEYFNNYLKQAHGSQNEYHVTSNKTFTNFTCSGSMGRNLEYFSISVYMDGITRYVADIGLDAIMEIYLVKTSDATIYVRNNNGRYVFIGCEFKQEDTLPAVTYDDITLNDDNTVSLSDDYMKRLYTAWVESDIESSWNAGYSIDYAEIVSLIDTNESAEFKTTVSFDDNGVINAYNIVLSDNDKVYYTFDFENSDTKTTAKLTMDIRLTINSEFVYVKGENEYATFDAKFNNEGQWEEPDDYHLRFDVLTNLPDFEYPSELKKEIDTVKEGMALTDVAAEKYAGEFVLEDSCLVMFYDAELDAYVGFEPGENNTGVFGAVFKDIPVYLEDYACMCSIDMETRTITVIQHSNQETVMPVLTEKYAGKYTVEGDSEAICIIVFDAESGKYIVFDCLADGSAEFDTTVPCGYEQLYPAVYPVAIADIENKTLTIQ